MENLSPLKKAILQLREKEIYNELISLNHDTDMAVNLRGELDEIVGKLDGLDVNMKNEKLPTDIKDVLLKVNKAYQGVGDLEGTGENMIVVICDVRDILDKYNIVWK